MYSFLHFHRVLNKKEMIHLKGKTMSPHKDTITKLRNAHSSTTAQNEKSTMGPAAQDQARTCVDFVGHRIQKSLGLDI